MTAMAENSNMIGVELEKTKDGSYLVNVIKISKDFYKKEEQKHHYAIDPEVKVFAKPERDQGLKDSMVTHFNFSKMLTASSFKYKEISNGPSTLFSLFCDKPCAKDEMCTVFGCQLQTLKGYKG